MRRMAGSVTSTIFGLAIANGCPCGSPAGPVCDACRRALLGHGRGHVVQPHPVPPGLPLCAAAVPYADPARRLIIAYKERRRRDLAPVLAQALGLSLAASPALCDAPLSRCRPTDPGIVLVPVPPSRRSLRERGVDHVALLVRLLIAELAPRCARRVRWMAALEPAKVVADQSGLSAVGRRSNLMGALRTRPGAARALSRGSPTVVLVDDVLTTGSTLAEAARALRHVGIPVKSAVVVAAAMRHAALGIPSLSRAQNGD